MIKANIYINDNALDFLPDILDTNKCILATPIKDYLFTGDKLGHLILFPGDQVMFDKGKASGRPLNRNQLNRGFLGSFLFVGNNPNYFHHLFNSNFTGKYLENKIMIDNGASNVISYEFNRIVKYYINYIQKEMSKNV